MRLTRFVLGIYLLFVATCCMAQTPAMVGVTGHYRNPDGTPATGLTVQFTLTNCATGVPRIFGTSSIVTVTQPFIVDNTGLLSGSIWPNDVINCGGITGNSRWTATQVLNNVPQTLPVCYNVLASTNLNLDTATPCPQMNPPTSPGVAKDGTFNNLTVLGQLIAPTVNLTVRALNGIVANVDNYPGATISEKLAAADAAWVGKPVTLTINTPGVMSTTFYPTISRFHNVLFNANVNGTGAQVWMQLSGDQKVECLKGVVLTGGDRVIETIGTYGASHPGTMLVQNLDLGQGCRFTGQTYAPINLPAYVDNTYIHDLTIDFGVSGIVVGNGANDGTVQPANVATLADDVSQPHYTKIERLNAQDLTGSAINTFNMHNFEVSGSHCLRVSIGYCMVTAGGDAGGFQVPIGNVSNINFHDNDCDRTYACEWVAMGKHVTIGHGTHSRNTGDVGEDLEGVVDGMIDSPDCESAATGCATVFFYQKNAIIQHAHSLDSRILIRNSSGDVNNDIGLRIIGNVVPEISADATSGLEVADNFVNGFISLGFNAGSIVHGNHVLIPVSGTVPQFGINLGIPFNGEMQRVYDNVVKAVGTPVSGSTAFRVQSGYFSADTLTTFERNWNDGFPVAFQLNTGQNNLGPSAPVARWFLHFNHLGGGTVVHNVTAGTGTVYQDAWYDASEALHFGAISLPVSTANGMFVCRAADGTLFYKATACQ